MSKSYGKLILIFLILNFGCVSSRVETPSISAEERNRRQYELVQATINSHPGKEHENQRYVVAEKLYTESYERIKDKVCYKPLTTGECSSNYVAGKNADFGIVFPEENSRANSEKSQKKESVSSNLLKQCQQYDNGKLSMKFECVGLGFNGMCPFANRKVLVHAYGKGISISKEYFIDPAGKLEIDYEPLAPSTLTIEFNPTCLKLVFLETVKNCDQELYFKMHSDACKKI